MQGPRYNTIENTLSFGLRNKYYLYLLSSIKLSSTSYWNATGEIAFEVLNESFIR